MSDTKRGHNAEEGKRGFQKTGTQVPVPPTPKRIIRSSGSALLHPFLAGQSDTIPWPKRLAKLGEAQRAHKLAKDALAVVRSKYGVDGVAPATCSACGHSHHLEHKQKIDNGSYMNSTMCEAPAPEYNSSSMQCICNKSILANEGQVAMYKAEQVVAQALEAGRCAQKEVNEPQPTDTYFVVKGLRSRNKFGSVVLTKDDESRVKVLLALQDNNGNPVGQKWFKLKNLKRSLVHQGLV